MRTHDQSRSNCDDKTPTTSAVPLSAPARQQQSVAASSSLPGPSSSVAAADDVVDASVSQSHKKTVTFIFDAARSSEDVSATPNNEAFMFEGSAGSTSHHDFADSPPRAGSRSSAYVFPAPNTDAVQLISGSVWAFFPPSHVKIAKVVLLGYFIVVVFATLGSLGYPLANKLPLECKPQLEQYYYSFGFFAASVCVLLPLWATAFFDHMLSALQEGLQPFVSTNDREKTIALGIAMLAATGAALFGLHVAPPPALGEDISQHPCGSANSIVRFCSFSFLTGTGLLALLHVVHYQYMTHARRKFMESQRAVLY